MNKFLFDESSRREIIKTVIELAEPVDPIFAAGETPVPVTSKLIGIEEIISMVEASLDGWLTTGRFNEKFEQDLSAVFGLNYCRTCNSGSSANLLAFSALTSDRLGKRAIKPDDEVICVAAGFPTTVNPIIQSGAIPVFIDIELNTLNVDCSLLVGALSEKTKAVMIAHTLGNPFNVNAIKEFCDQHGLWLIEDCCDALGSTFDGEQVGTVGDLATLSFYPAHHITMGEGGAVLSNSRELIEIVESFRDWGRDCYCPPGKDNTCGKRFDWRLGDLPEGYDHKYIYSHIGYNLKITDMQASCGLAQLKKLENFTAARRRNFQFLYNELEELSDLFFLPTSHPLGNPSWFGFPLTIKHHVTVSRRELLEYLNQAKIGTRLLFAGNITKQPGMKGVRYRVASPLTQTDHVMENTFWLGVHPALTEDMLRFTSDSLKNYLGIGF